MDDDNLIRGCINQDKKSWDLFVERYGKLIYSTLHRVLGEKGITDKKEIVDELFNETFVALMQDDAKKVQQFQGRCPRS